MKIVRFLILLAFLYSISTANAQTQNKIEKIAPSLAAKNDMVEVKSRIAKILDNDTKWIQDPTNGTFGSPKDIQVFDDRIECKIKNKKTAIKFSDLIDCNIELERFSQTGEDGKFYLIRYQVDLKYYMIYFKMNESPALQFTNDLYFIQHQLREKRFGSQLKHYEEIAAKYRELKVKPAVSEEQRKYIVQANSCNQQKMYNKAIELYNKVIEVDQTSYPAGYSNLALLSAQINKFDAAIYYMKIYLLFEPDASDSRNAQDKIYEWELVMGK